MSWSFKGSRLFWEEDEIGGRSVAVTMLPNDLKITAVQELVRVRAFDNAEAIERTFYFDPQTGQLWEARFEGVA